MKCPNCARFTRWDPTRAAWYCDNCERAAVPPGPADTAPREPSPPIGRVLMVACDCGADRGEFFTAHPSGHAVTCATRRAR